MTGRWFRCRIASLALVTVLLGALISQTAFTQSPNRSDLRDASKFPPLSLSQINATASPDGVLIEWRTSFEINNLGFNVYRVQNGERTQVNRTLVPGSALIVGEGRALYGGYYYSSFDPQGTLECEYYLEDLSTAGKHTLHDPVKPVWSPAPNRPESSISAASAGESAQREWAGAEQISASQSAPETIADQWAIAALPVGEVLKIAVKQEGWYHITQGQLAAAGLVIASRDARNLRMFVGGAELAIRVSRNSGPMNASDYVEFYGTGLDILSTDTRTYYLVNGTQPGLRIPPVGEVKPDATPSPHGPPTWEPPKKDVSVGTSPGWFVGAVMGAGIGEIDNSVIDNSVKERSNPIISNQSEPALSFPQESLHPPASAARLATPNSSSVKSAEAKKEDSAVNGSSLLAYSAASRPALKSSSNKHRRTRDLSALRKPDKLRVRHQRMHRRISSSALRRRNHAVAPTVTSAAPNFAYTVLRRDRKIYFTTVLNGSAENFFGDTVSGPTSSTPNPTPTTETLNLQNVEMSAAGPAQLKVALQGVLQQAHQVSVKFNGVLVGYVSFFGLEHKEQTFTVPVSLLVEGNNSVQVVGTAPFSGNTSDFSLVDYTQITYPHSLKATNNTLRFSLRYTQSARIDGFTCANNRCDDIRILDITNPMAVREVRPIVEPSGSGYALTVVATGGQTKGLRTLIALPAAGTQLNQAAFTLNQPSTWNLGTNAANLVIISYETFIPSLAPLVAQRQAQGFTVAVINVEDLYDEFSYGAHSPQAITDFVSRARAAWAVPPQYLLLVGDGSYDPRDFQGFGFCDFVPAKLVDATYNETASDDALVDFNGDGIADIPIGRFPARTLAQANLMVSKTVNFIPPNPQKALLVADAQGSYYFNFEAANDEVAAQLQSLSPGIIIQKVYRARYPTTPDARADLISKWNAGPALVNYSGHGNVNSWAGGLFSTDDALACANGSSLPFVVVMDCLNGYFVEPRLPGEGIGEGLLKAPNGGSVASFASTGLTIPERQHEMSRALYQLLYDGSTPVMRVGDAIIQSKLATSDIDVRRTWVLLGDPTLKIR
jgi:hypothetical protein